MEEHACRTCAGPQYFQQAGSRFGCFAKADADQFSRVLKSNEMTVCSFQSQLALVCGSFKNCEGLSRVRSSWMTTVLFGKVVSFEWKDDSVAAGGQKKCTMNLPDFVCSVQCSGQRGELNNTRTPL